MPNPCWISDRPMHGCPCVPEKPLISLQICCMESRCFEASQYRDAFWQWSDRLRLLWLEGEMENQPAYRRCVSGGFVVSEVDDSAG